MNSVWIVTFDYPDEEGTAIVGVCSSEEVAQALAEQQPYGSRGEYIVEEYEVREAH